MIFNRFAFKYVPYILENDNLIRLIGKIRLVK